MAKDTLVIVESPNKIKKISSYLGKGFIVRASVGHIIDLAIGNKQFPLGVDLENDYKPKYRILADKKDVVKSLIDAATGADKIYLATDPDREGEAIAWHLKDCLESTGKPIKRVTFNAVTKSAVNTAIKNPGDLNEDLFDAQQARRVLDRIVGFMASEQLRHFFGPHLSAGRVQSVAVRLIVDREREIENFVPEEYWNIAANLAKPANLQEKFVAKYTKKVTDEKTAKKIKTDLDKDNYVIKDVISKEKSRNPLPPLTTPSLQKAVGNRYGFSVSKTMRAAQSLYESGFVTYIRTDSQRIEPEAIKSVRDYLTKNNYKVPTKPNIYGSKGSAQDAHECIRPTDILQEPHKVFLSDDHQKVYRVIWERFVASQMEPAVYDTVSVTVESSSGHLLKANGRTLKYEGWLAIATDHKKQGKDDIQLPVLAQKDKVVLVPPKVKAEQKFTQPPPRFTEVGLVDELEKKGIGRPSTYAAIIEKIRGRNYVEVLKKSYHATDLGKKVVDSLAKHFQFMDYQYTAHMETRLDKVADGELGYVEMLDEFFIPFQKECHKAELQESPDYGIPCPECSERTILRHGRFGFYLACINRPDCKGTISVNIEDGKPVIKEFYEKKVVPGVKCPNCNAGMCRRDGKFGPFYSCEKYPKCKGSAKIPFGKKCSDCGEELFLTVFYRNGTGQKKLACMGYPNCKHIEDVPEDAANDWIDPVKIQPPKRKRTAKKVLSASRKKKKSK